MRYICIILANLSVAISELKFVSVVYRHGDLAPTFIYPKDPHPSSVWTNGLGMLTESGKNQSYELGKYFRKRYQNFLPEKFDKYDVYVISSQREEAIRSTRFVLDGLYEFGHPTIHVLPFVFDNYLFYTMSCLKYKNLVNDLLLSEREKVSWFSGVLKNMSESTGVNSTCGALENLSLITNIHDCLLAEEKLGLDLPEWTKGFYPQPLREIKEFRYAMEGRSRPMKRLRCGPLLRDIIQNFEDVANKTTSFKMWQYSGHDQTIVNLLQCLEVFDGELVPPSSAVFLEFYETNNEFEVLVTYKKNDEVIELEMPNCTLRCPFERFKESHKDLLPDDWHSECNFSNSPALNYLLIFFCGILLTCK